MLGLNHKLSHAFRAWVVFDRLRLHNVVVTRYAQVHTVITVLNTEHHNWNTPRGLRTLSLLTASTAIQGPIRPPNRDGRSALRSALDLS